jgi:hypothetical protein
VAIPAALDEAATVLTEVAPEEVESLIRTASSSKLAGWQSPMSDSFYSDGHHSPIPSLPVAFPSTKGSSGRNDGFYIQRAVSPSYSSSPPASTVFGTPSTSPSPPRELHTPASHLHLKSSASPPPPLSLVRSGSSSPGRTGSPVALSPSRMTGFSLEAPIVAGHSLPPSPQAEAFGEEDLLQKTRRLSFFSYADLISEATLSSVRRIGI